MVKVWSITDTRGRGQIKLKQPLYGHTAGVLCLTASAAFNIFVSGSCDRTCIVWDLSRLQYRTQLPDHIAPVTAVSINNMTGVIASSAGSWLYVWSINGERLASVDTTSNAGHLQINCVHMSQANDWDIDNVIMTGGSDGVVRMWSIRLKEVINIKSVEVSKDSEQSAELKVVKSIDTPETLSVESASVSSVDEKTETDGSCESKRPIPAQR